ncbi:MAG: hypothetical protein WCL51_12875 [Bacteroidota bacterium]
MEKHEQLKEILYEILDDNKGWLSLGEIENVLIEKYSFIKGYKSSMKKILRFNRDIFECNDKLKAFILVKHLNLLDKDRTSKLKKIIYNYFDRNENPIHFDEIFKYVQCYNSESNKDTVGAILNKYRKSCFIRFEGNKFGISSKKYSEEYVPVKSVFRDYPQITMFSLLTEILNNNDEPLHINEITETLIKLRPLVTKKNVLRSITVNREKFKIFINKYYGLASKEYAAEWKEISIDIEAWTITSLITKYLANEELPKHLSEITDYIHCLRPEIGIGSIYTNLRYHNKLIFVNFENNLFGLCLKTYPIEYILHNVKTPIRLTKIITNYLKKEREPKSFSDIYEYLNKKYHYSRKSTLKQYFFENTRNRYIKFENKYYGLATKIYSKKYIEYIEVKKTGSKEPIYKIVSEYLSRYETPVHKFELFKYVLEQKPYSNEKSIRTTIRFYDNLKFRYFENGYIGLINKEYTNDYVVNAKLYKKKDTIEIIIQKILEEERYPILIETLFEYVIMQKPLIQEKSILTLLYLKREKFRFFENNFIGLQAKEYSVKFIEKEKNERG